MKTKNILWIILLLISFSVFAQKGNEKIYTWEEAQKVEDPLTVLNLDMSRMKLTEIPKELQKFSNLHYLDLSKNRLKEIPAIFNGFDSLKVFKIERNKMTLFPVAVCQMRNLEEFWGYDNNFATIPKCIGNDSQLKLIDVSDNLIESLPNELMQLKNLQKLDLGGMTINKYFQKEWHEKLPNVHIIFGQPCDCMSH